MSRKVEIIITAILWISAAISIYFNNIMDIRFLFGIITLATVTVFLFIKKYNYSLIILFFSLLLATFDVLLFNLAFGMHFGVINVIPFVLLIVLTLFRKDEFLDFAEEWLDLNQDENDKAKEGKIDYFKQKFQDFSTRELIHRLENIELVAEAKIAIEIILSERDMTNKFVP